MLYIASSTYMLYIGAFTYFLYILAYEYVTLKNGLSYLAPIADLNFFFQPVLKHVNTDFKSDNDLQIWPTELRTE